MNDFTQQQELVKVLKFWRFFQRAYQLEISNKGSNPWFKAWSVRRIQQGFKAMVWTTKS
jgi:hypothetical protein